MNSDAIWTEPDESRLQREDEVRMQELRRLFDSMDEREKAAEAELEEALSILSWSKFEDLDVCPGLDDLERGHYRQSYYIDIYRIAEHRTWLSALRSAMSSLTKTQLVPDSSLLINLRSTLSRYAEISYPNLLVMIQPKLQTLNSIEA
jgi:hypothetical protein